jgi:Cu(I)/Ag(I) efflux system membrane fusion protein
MKKIIEYISSNWQQKLIVLLLGLLLGWLIFGGKSESHHSHGSDMLTENASSAESTTWTCSMHPQIQQPNEGDCPICGMDLIPMDQSSGSSSPAIINMNADAIKLANVQTTKVESGQSGKEILLNGKVSIDERRISSQAIHFDGRIEKLHVNFEGEKVSKGQTLATVYAPKLISAQEELFQAMQTVSKYPELVKAAEQKLKYWKLSQSQIEKIKSSGKLQEYFEIKADVSGYVIKRNIEEGAYAKAGSVLFKIADLQKVWIVFDAYEKDLSFINTGDDIEFTVSSFPSKTFNSTISYIDPIVNSKKRIVKVRTETNNTNFLLKPEMFASGIIYADIKHSSSELIIPKSAVMWTGKRSIAYVKVDGGFEMRDIEIGESLGDSYVLKEGIESGEEVVTKGTFTIDAAAQLNNKYSMMNRPGSEPGAPKLHQFVTDSFSEKLKALLSSYLKMKDIMVETKAKESNEAAKSVMKALMQMKPSEVDLKGKTLKYWKEKYELLHNHLADITTSEEMEAQRKAFKPFNEELIASMKSLGSGVEKVFVQYCPMADNDTGAYWLSLEEKIMNPYFGDLMLHCGEVSDSLMREKPKTMHHGHQH